MHIILENMSKIIILILCYTQTITLPEDPILVVKIFKLNNSLDVFWEWQMFLGLLFQIRILHCRTIDLPKQSHSRMDSTNMCYRDSQTELWVEDAWSATHTLSLRSWAFKLPSLGFLVCKCRLQSPLHRKDAGDTKLRVTTITYCYVRNHYPSELFVNDHVNQFCDLKLNWEPLNKAANNKPCTGCCF